MTGLVELKVERSHTHAGGGGNRGEEGRQGRHDDFNHDFNDSFLFVVHSVLVLRINDLG